MLRACFRNAVCDNVFFHAGVLVVINTDVCFSYVKSYDNTAQDSSFVADDVSSQKSRRSTIKTVIFNKSNNTVILILFKK